MIRSIYEEITKKINVEFDAWDRAKNLEFFELVEQALEQAQKQEKLLELYKEYFRLDTLRITFNTEFYKLKEIEKQIKELENDKKDL